MAEDCLLSAYYMPGSVLITLYTLNPLVLTTNQELDTIIHPILQMEKLRHGRLCILAKVTKLVSGKAGIYTQCSSKFLALYIIYTLECSASVSWASLVELLLSYRLSYYCHQYHRCQQFSSRILSPSTWLAGTATSRPWLTCRAGLSKDHANSGKEHQ